MIKTTYDELGKMSTQQAVQKLANSSFKNPKAFYVKRLTKSVRDGFFKMRDEYKKLEDGYRDGDGDLPPAEGSKSAALKLPFICKEGKEEEAKAALDAFGKREFKLELCAKIDPELLFEVNEWSPRELEGLEFLVKDPGDAT